MSVVDSRGVSTFQNANYNELAFPDIQVNYDSVNKKINVIHKENTPAYISSFTGVSGISLNSAEDLGLSATYTSLVSIDKQLSSKIITVVNDIQDRSQITTRAIYISPIIQIMNLVGTIYLKDLYDIGTERTNIEDAIYSWVNNNIDFNTPVYLSNLIEIIENFPSVLYSDIRFVPKVPINPSGGYWTNIDSSLSAALSGENNIVKNYVKQQIGYKIFSYQNGAVNDLQSDISGVNEKNINQLQEYSFEWARDINERTFLEVLAKDLYNYFKSLEYGTMKDFADSDNFISFISNIRKDYLKIIRYNLIDTKGNIAEDIQLDSNNKPIKGGYSLGNEIVKIECVLNYEYKR